MKITVTWIGKTREPAIQALTSEYVKRIARYAQIESWEFRDEAAFLQYIWGEKKRGRKAAQSVLVLMDARGKQVSSEEFAHFIQNHQDRNPLPLSFAIGPSNGFSGEARNLAHQSLALGKITLAHELARVVLLEQLYRAFTILKGHPYHSGH